MAHSKNSNSALCDQSLINQVEEIFGTTLESYKSQREYLKELQKVLDKDYGVYLTGAALEEAGDNISKFLSVFIVKRSDTV